MSERGKEKEREGGRAGKRKRITGLETEGGKKSVLFVLLVPSLAC